jgi:hypothetical protein
VAEDEEEDFAREMGERERLVLVCRDKVKSRESFFRSHRRRCGLVGLGLSGREGFRGGTR